MAFMIPDQITIDPREVRGRRCNHKIVVMRALIRKYRQTGNIQAGAHSVSITIDKPSRGHKVRKEVQVTLSHPVTLISPYHISTNEFINSFFSKYSELHTETLMPGEIIELDSGEGLEYYTITEPFFITRQDGELKFGTISSLKIAEGGMGKIKRYIPYKKKAANSLEVDYTQALMVVKVQKLFTQGHKFLYENEKYFLTILKHFRLHSPVEAHFVNMFVKTYLIQMQLPGMDLLRFMQINNNLDSKQLLILFQKLCEALYVVQSANIIHNDVKFENFMILADQVDHEGKINFDQAVIALIDFGLAVDMNRVVHTGGTVEFQSPESTYRDKTSAVSDIYSLGTMFCSMLSTNPLESWLKTQLYGLVEWMLEVDMAKRASLYDCITFLSKLRAMLERNPHIDDTDIIEADYKLILNTFLSDTTNPQEMIHTTLLAIKFAENNPLLSVNQFVKHLIRPIPYNVFPRYFRNYQQFLLAHTPPITLIKCQTFAELTSFVQNIWHNYTNHAAHIAYYDDRIKQISYSLTQHIGNGPSDNPQLLALQDAFAYCRHITERPVTIESMAQYYELVVKIEGILATLSHLPLPEQQIASNYCKP